MKCQYLMDILGFDCQEVEMINDGHAIRLTLPITTLDDSPISLVFTRLQDGKVVISDDANILFMMLGEGFNLSDRRRWKTLENLASNFSIKLEKTGEFRAVYKSQDELKFFFGDWLCFCSEVVRWQKERNSLAQRHIEFCDEVEILLRTWKKGSKILKKVQVSGLSNQVYDFDFRIEDQLVDTITPNGHSTGSRLRKVLDVKGLQEDANILVIMDDREHKEKATYEIGILSNVVSVMRYSNLASKVDSPEMH